MRSALRGDVIKNITRKYIASTYLRLRATPVTRLGRSFALPSLALCGERGCDSHIFKNTIRLPWQPGLLLGSAQLLRESLATEVVKQQSRADQSWYLSGSGDSKAAPRGYFCCQTVFRKFVGRPYAGKVQNEYEFEQK
jgi:hypothetical protein